MPGIKEEVFLNCQPETAFREYSDVNFISKIGAAIGITENEIIFLNDRLVKFDTKIKYNNNILSLSSERILIPENLTIVTRRTNVPMLKYNVIINTFKKHEAGTIMMHIDEFETEAPNPEADGQSLSRLKMTTKQLMDKVTAYFK